MQFKVENNHLWHTVKGIFEYNNASFEASLTTNIYFGVTSSMYDTIKCNYPSCTDEKMRQRWVKTQ